jgi:regulator of protease activity HflC (stomatin/prohibitin superfamily)
MDVRTQEYTMSVAPGEGAVYQDDSMTAPTADGQTVTVDATVLFHVDRDKAADLFQSVGPDYVQKIVRTVSRSQIRAVIANYSAIDVYAIKREEAEQKINEVIRELFAEKDVILERVLLRHIAFSPQFADSIEKKKVAEQKRIEAEELKKKKIIEAEAEAEAIRLKGEMLNRHPKVIQFEFVQKMSPNINWGVLPDNILPLLNLGGQ